VKRKLFWIVPLTLVVLAGIIYPWYKLQSQNQKNTEQAENLAISTSFSQFYGSTAHITNITAPKIIRAVYWTDNQYIHASLYIDGVWFEYAREDKAQSKQPTPALSPTPTSGP